MARQGRVRGEGKDVCDICQLSRLRRRYFVSQLTGWNIHFTHRYISLSLIVLQSHHSFIFTHFLIKASSWYTANLPPINYENLLFQNCHPPSMPVCEPWFGSLIKYMTQAGSHESRFEIDIFLEYVDDLWWGKKKKWKKCHPSLLSWRRWHTSRWKAVSGLCEGVGSGGAVQTLPLTFNYTLGDLIHNSYPGEMWSSKQTKHRSLRLLLYYYRWTFGLSSSSALPNVSVWYNFISVGVDISAIALTWN